MIENSSLQSVAGQANNPYLGATATQGVAPPQPFLVELGQRISTLNAVLSDSNNELATLRSRLFGPWPESNTASGANKAESMASDILAALDRVLSLAGQVRENAQVLNGNI